MILVLHLLSISIITLIYLISTKWKNKKYFGNFLFLSGIGFFFLINFLINYGIDKMTMGISFALFALVSIIRLRINISNFRDLSFIFFVIILSIINGNFVFDGFSETGFINLIFINILGILGLCSFLFNGKK